MSRMILKSDCRIRGRDTPRPNPPDPPDPPGDPWTPNNLGERIYRNWSGNNSATIPGASNHYKSCHWAIVVFDSAFSIGMNSASGKPQPLLSFSNGTVLAQWARTTSDLNEISVDSVGAGTHLLISHRRAGQHFFRLDGVEHGPVGSGIVCPQPRGSVPDGAITYNGPLAMLGSGDGLTDTEVEKIEGWARINHGVSLPVNHRYANATPRQQRGDWDDTFEIRPTQAEWDAMVYVKTNEGDPASSTQLAWDQTWAAQFDAGVRIGNEWDAPDGLDFFARVHGAGVAQATPANLSSIANDGNPHYHYMTFNGEPCIRGRMERVGSSNRGPIWASCNQAGMGNIFKPPFLARTRFAFANDTDPIPTTDHYNFPAWWLKEVEGELIYPFFNNWEWDVMEGDSDSPFHMNNVIHFHEPIQATNVGPDGDNNFRVSLGFTKANGVAPQTQYDAEWHEWACSIDENWVIHYFGPGDGTLYETSRCPSHPGMLNRHYFFYYDFALRTGAQNLADFIAAGKPSDMYVSALTVQQP